MRQLATQLCPAPASAGEGKRHAHDVHVRGAVPSHEQDVRSALTYCKEMIYRISRTPLQRIQLLGAQGFRVRNLSCQAPPFATFPGNS